MNNNKLKIYKFIILLIPAVFVFIFQGCGSYNHSVPQALPEAAGDDSTPQEPAEPVIKDATLVIGRHNLPDTLIGIEQIDHERLEYTGYKSGEKYTLAPGRHTVFYFFIKLRRISVISSADLNISFSAEAGHTYELKNYARWNDEFSEDVNAVDFLTMIIDRTKGEVVVWESRGTGDFKEEVRNKSGFIFTETAEKKAFAAGILRKIRNAVSAPGENKYAAQDGDNSDCLPDCLPLDTNPTVLSVGNKAAFLDFVYKGNKSGIPKTVFLDFVYKGSKYGIYFFVNRIVHEKLASLSNSVIYKKGEDEVTKKDFILKSIDNELQKERLLPLVEKIRSLTPDVHKQARIAISLVQNIPYTNVDNIEKYPYGVIWKHGGSCSAKSDLLLFLLRELGFGTSALIHKSKWHRSVGIKCPDEYDVDDTGYCYVEVTTPTIITDNMTDFEGAGALTDFEVIDISDGIRLEGLEEEFADKNIYHELINKIKAQDGVLSPDDYDLYKSVLIKYGME